MGRNKASASHLSQAIRLPMKYRFLLFLFLLPLAAFADTQSARPDIDELMQVSRVEKTTRDSLAAVSKVLEQTMTQAGMAGSAASTKKFDDTILNIIQSSYDWDNIKGDYAAAYAQVYTPDEARQLIDFYKSPTGQNFLDKQPLLTQKTMELIQQTVMEVMRKKTGLPLGGTPGQTVASPSPGPQVPRPDVEELIEVSRMDQLYGKALGSTKFRLSAPGSSGSSAGNSITADIAAEYSWDNMKDKFATLYAEVYTPDEVKQMIAFYKSPTGQMYLDKEPLLTAKMQEIGQKMLPAIMPKLQAAIMAYTAQASNAAIAAANASAEATPPGNPVTTAPLNGRYLLDACPTNVEVMDGIEFHPDGTCLMDVDGSTGIPGAYKIPSEGQMTIQSNDGLHGFHYLARRGDINLNFSTENDPTGFYYSLVPKDRQHIDFSDVLGSYLCRDSYGDCVTTITPDHKFHVNGRYLDSQARTYSDYTTDGTCSFNDGIVTYFTQHSTDSQEYKYVRDVLVKHDAGGLWGTDVYEDKVLIETPQKNADLPPPPPGYTQQPLN